MPTREALVAECGLDSRPIVALLAGSRTSEIKANLKDMAAIAERMPEYQFVVTAVPWIERAYKLKYFQPCRCSCVVVVILRYAIIEMLCTMFLIYGMLMVRKHTGNAWGCVLIFFVYWNAL